MQEYSKKNVIEERCSTPLMETVTSHALILDSVATFQEYTGNSDN